ncbi:ATP-dependent bile acid permease [Sphaceloma murrayae]|uniref:ATP-dependent bile acid permease n=1 Tax=Sphaceloma murrayae TaxID=2082308 RepID=A0A2K1QKU6_9PEZI|nr:ATP-dependent bile acid permease [Sphaceloma murrayae]
MFAHCKGPLWRYDDFSACFQQDYLQTLIPLIAVGISISLLSIQILSSPWRKQSHDGYTVIDPTGTYVHTNGNHKHPDSASEDDTDDDLEEAGHLTLQTTISKVPVSTYTVDKPKGELIVPVIEELAVVADLGIQIAALATGAWGEHGGTAAAASVAVWVYITALTSLRLLFTFKPSLSLPNVWYHTTFLYFLEWVCGVLLFRSQIIHPVSRLGQGLMIAHFALATFLFIIALGTRIGNAAVELEYEHNLEPSKELTSSVFGYATFTWLDPLIYKAYKGTLEISDVWNLIPEDKAAKILADYRQVKKTSSLALHLLKFFSRDIFLQAFFAAICGLNTFIPTLLLKVILEYVENPGLKSANAAWFYVILMFVSGTVQALSAGQALFIGRKICIRLRAVIIGEIYAKALRRRAAATSDKVLGQEQQNKDEKKPPGLVKKVSMFFMKKKDKPTQPTVKPPTEEGQVTSGAIINLMAVDSFKVAEVCAYLHFLWAETPVQLVIAIVLLYKLLGYSSIAGIGMMVILAPINLVISKQFAKIQKKILAATDARIHTTNEVLTNIRIIKYFAWEQRFMAQVDEKRTTELYYLRNRYIVWSLAATTWSGAPVVISFLTFMVYTIIEKRPLIPSVAFTALSLFSILRVPLDQLADMVAHVQESKVSVDRVEEYLNEAETEKYEQLKPDQYDDSGEPIIGFDNCNFSWGSTGEEDFKLIDVDMRFKVGQLNVIVGPTGSGKTSMLMALLGEMSLLRGSVCLPGVKSREDVRADPETGLTETVAYCAQQAWLVNGTIKDNIIFASTFDAQRYKDVIVACSLQRDLEILSNGDQTLVGEKGVSLSGGQKQRISLARALYCRARHVLLDDVLSAVDAHTAKFIFDTAIMGPLMYHRTCILVTHNTQLCVPRADFGVVMDNGRVVAQGSATHIIDSGKLSEDLSKSRPVSRAPSRIPSRVPSDVGGDNETLLDKSLSEANANGNANGGIGGAPAEYRDGADLVRVVSNKAVPGPGPEANASASATMPEEEKAVGSVSLKIIFMYLKSMGGFYYWLVACLAFALQQLSQVGTNIWIRQWANAYGDRQEYSTHAAVNTSSMTHVRTTFGINHACIKSGTCFWPMSLSSSPRLNEIGTQTTQDGVNDAYYLGIYAVIGLTFMLVTLLRVGWVFYGSIVASRAIHRKLMDAVLHAKFKFFDQTPLGRLTNRFSKDIELVDQEIAPVAEGVVHCLASIITIIVLISAITPQFLIAAVFISILYFLIGSFYINSSRDLKRMESVQRSPLYQQFGETLSGMTTIRAYGDERRFVRENIQKINTHSRPFIFLWAANRWLAFRVDIVGALVSFFTGVFVILSVGRIDGGAAGLAMTYAVSFTENVLWFVRLYSMNEQNMNAIERIKEYFDVEQEAPPIVEENRPPSNWPSKGSVELIGYSTRYRPDFDFVLKDITFKILAGEKVGVVGRTGAGKSSLALALFRALEAEEGKILIDDIDIGLIGLQDLRENIVMVPQDPTLFTGTIRNNLDPFNLYTDEEIYSALRRVQLIGAPGTSAEPSRPSTPVPPTTSSSITSSPTAKHLAPTSSPPMPSSQTLENKNIFHNLSSSVAESGSNLSQGQRQLLCLARALLKSPKVLLMDEATASIDYATDAKIQETIREFKNTTMTIAHRLRSIVDYDKVLVLDKGSVVEFGSPWDLIKKEDGSFRSMCESSGEREELERLAERARKEKRLVDDE